MILFHSDSRSTLQRMPVRALLLGAALAGSVVAVQAQTTTPSPASPMSPPSMTAPPVATPGKTADAIPANKMDARDVVAAFVRADTNKDGKLSREETERYPEIASRFEQIDGNKDSFLSRDEFSKAAGV
jgi:hypothetical protein